MKKTLVICAVAMALTLGPAIGLAGAQGKPAGKGPKATPPGHAMTPKAAQGKPVPKSVSTPKVKAPKAPPPGHAKPPKTQKVAPVPITPTTPVLISAPVPNNPKLVARLQPLLPVGMTVEQAAAGFRNQGQFVAAVHVSRNLGIPFAQLKTEMVTNNLSLGQSIQRLRPHVDGAAAARLAQQSAARDLR
jgi:hypothetical protein